MEAIVMRKVEINQSTFERLQGCAEPFVDTLDAVINRAIDALERANLSPADRTPERTTATSDDSISFDANAPLPDVKHTKVLRAVVGGRSVRRPNWNNVWRHVLRLAVDAGHSADEIRYLCAANVVAGEKEDEGYHYLAEMRMSYQGLNANAAAAAVVALAKGVGVALELDWIWRQKPQALHPGRRAQLRLPGRETGG